MFCVFIIGFASVRTSLNKTFVEYDRKGIDSRRGALIADIIQALRQGPVVQADREAAGLPLNWSRTARTASGRLEKIELRLIGI